MQNKRFINYETAIKKLEKFCSIQERCRHDVIIKLHKLNYFKKHEQIISYLVSNNFINEERFALLYCNGKFSIKKWGKIKISYNLKQKGIDNTYILKSIKKIPEKKYTETIKDLITKKTKTINEKDSYKKNCAIARYLMQKGFETDLIWKLINKNSK